MLVSDLLNCLRVRSQSIGKVCYSNGNAHVDCELNLVLMMCRSLHVIVALSTLDLLSLYCLPCNGRSIVCTQELTYFLCIPHSRSHIALKHSHNINTSYTNTDITMACDVSCKANNIYWWMLLLLFVFVLMLIVLT